MACPHTNPRLRAIFLIVKHNAPPEHGKLPSLRDILEIIEAALKERGISARQASLAAVGTPEMIRDMRRGRVPSVLRVRALCRVLGIDFHIGKRRERDALQPGHLGRDRLRDLVTGARALNQLVLDAGGQPFPGPIAVPVSAAAGSHWIPLRYMVAASAAEGRVLAGEDGHLAFHRDWMASRGMDPTQCVGIVMTGDSMEPTLPRGSVIVVDRTRRRRLTGRIYAVRNEDGVLVGRAKRGKTRGWVIACDNPAAAPVPWDANAELIGQVRWAGHAVY